MKNIHFFEDYDGDIILSDINNFKDEKDFVEQAEAFLLENRGYRIPVTSTAVEDILVGEEEWKPGDDDDFEGEKMTVYAAVLDYDNADKEIKSK